MLPDRLPRAKETGLSVLLLGLLSLASCAVPTSTGVPTEGSGGGPRENEDGSGGTLPGGSGGSAVGNSGGDEGADGGAGSGAAEGSGGSGAGSGGQGGLGGPPALITVTSITLSCGAYAFPEDFGLPGDLGPADQSATVVGDTLEVTGTYTQVNQEISIKLDVEAPGVDLSGCDLTATLNATGGPACGLQALPFAWNGTFIAPDGGGYFIGEELSETPTTVTFTPTAATGVTRFGINVYSCGPPPFT